MPIKKRLINCDYFNTSGFSKLTNKAKLLYFYFLANADDKGFVGNGKEIAELLDQCEQEHENVLFSYKYCDALGELVERRLVYPFMDKCENVTYLIRHWFMHNKNQSFLSTNYVSYLAKVELVGDEYQLKPIKGENLKEKEIKGNKIKANQISNNLCKSFNDNNSDTTTIEKENKEKDHWDNDWDKFIKDLNDMPTNN